MAEALNKMMPFSQMVIEVLPKDINVDKSTERFQATVSFNFILMSVLCYASIIIIVICMYV